MFVGFVHWPFISSSKPCYTSWPLFPSSRPSNVWEEWPWYLNYFLKALPPPLLSAILSSLLVFLKKLQSQHSPMLWSLRMHIPFCSTPVRTEESPFPSWTPSSCKPSLRLIHSSVLWRKCHSASLPHTYLNGNIVCICVQGDKVLLLDQTWFRILKLLLGPSGPFLVKSNFS